MATEPRSNVGNVGLGVRLMAVFRASGRDPTQEITRLRHMLDKFLKHCWDESNKEVAARCCRDATNWYWTILDKLLHQESRRPGTRASSILGFDLIQRLLVVSSLEISITKNRLPCDFPELLRILQLSPYDFLKVVMLVIRAVGDVHQAVVGHLLQVEEKVLENLVWTRDSPLWEDIRANEGQLPSCLQVMSPSQLEDPVKTEQRADPDPPPTAGGRLGANLSASSEQQSSHAAEIRTKSLHPFARKVYGLMAGRLRELCTSLDISAELRLKIWTCFEYSLVHCTFLMADRHLDQLLMCAIYIAAKITQSEIPFKRIMKGYNSLPRTNTSVCKDVLFTGGVMEDFTTVNQKQSSAVLTPDTPSSHYPDTTQQKRGNLIHFYNNVYVQKLEPFAKQFAPNFKGDTPLSPYPREKTASTCKQRLPGHQSVFISHLNTEIQSLRKPAISYVISRSPRGLLRDINNMIKVGWPPSSPSCAPSADTQVEEEEDAKEESEDVPSAKRICLDDQSAWHRRLREVVNDRVAMKRK